MATRWKSMSTAGKIRRGHTLFWWALVYPVAVIAIGYTALSTYLHARAIQADHSIAQATISYDENDQPSERLTRFGYTFDVGGETYTGHFSTPNARADQVEIGGLMPVAYANFDPNQSQRPELLDMNADMKPGLTSFAIIAALGAVLIFVFWSLISYFPLRWLIGSLE